MTNVSPSKNLSILPPTEDQRVCGPYNGVLSHFMNVYFSWLVIVLLSTRLKPAFLIIYWLLIHNSSHEYKGSKQTLTLFFHMFGVHCSYKFAYGSGIISQWQYTKYFEPYYDNVKSFNIVSSWWSLSLRMPIQKYAI